MIHRIKVEGWIRDRSFALKHPSGATKLAQEYLPTMEREDFTWVEQKSEKLRLKGALDLVKVALCAGSHSRLWIGELDGLIAPMDVPPEGWTYPNQEPVEKSWFWQWTPSPKTEQILMHELEESNPLSGNPKYLKTLAPFQLERKHGAIAQINAIDLIQLPELFRPNTSFLFEIEG